MEKINFTLYNFEHSTDTKRLAMFDINKFDADK